MNWFKRANKEKGMINIGLVGYSSSKFDEDIAKDLIREAFDWIEQEYEGKSFCVVSGLTDVGIPALGYREAVRRGWKTSGVAPAEAKEYDWYDVDEIIIEGEKFGDESDKFLSMLDVFVKVGGGKQSAAEFEKAKKKGIETWEGELDAKE